MLYSIVTAILSFEWVARAPRSLPVQIGGWFKSNLNFFQPVSNKVSPGVKQSMDLCLQMRPGPFFWSSGLPMPLGRCSCKAKAGSRSNVYPCQGLYLQQVLISVVAVQPSSLHRQQTPVPAEGRKYPGLGYLQDLWGAHTPAGRMVLGISEALPQELPASRTLWDHPAGT